MIKRLQLVPMRNCDSFVYLQTATLYFSPVTRALLLNLTPYKTKELCRPRAAHLQTLWGSHPSALLGFLVRCNANEKDSFIKSRQTGTHHATFEMQIAPK